MIRIISARRFPDATRIDADYWLLRKTPGITLGNLGRNKEAIEQGEIYPPGNKQDKDLAALAAALRSGSPGR